MLALTIIAFAAAITFGLISVRLVNKVLRQKKIIESQRFNMVVLHSRLKALCNAQEIRKSIEENWEQSNSDR